MVEEALVAYEEALKYWPRSKKVRDAYETLKRAKE
jgi:hypothetical protein